MPNKHPSTASAAPVPPALAHAMQRYVVAAHLQQLAAAMGKRTPPAYALALMLTHRAASVEFFEAAGELAEPECAVLRCFVVLIDQDLGLGATP